LSEAEWGIREGDGQAAYIAMRTGTAGRETAGGTASVWASRANPWRLHAPGLGREHADFRLRA